MKMTKKQFAKSTTSVALLTLLLSKSKLPVNAQTSDNTKSENASNDVVYFESDDETLNSITDKTYTRNVYKANEITSGTKLSALFKKISRMGRNLKVLWNTIGNTDISKLADGTVTGAIGNTDISGLGNDITGSIYNLRDIVRGKIKMDGKCVDTLDFDLDSETGTLIITVTPHKL